MNYAKPLPDEMTIGEAYGPVVEIDSQDDADTYFELLVERHMRICPEHSREEATSVQKSNIGYYAGYYGHETRLRVESLFACRHPLLKPAAQGKVTPEEAFRAGEQMALNIQGKTTGKAWFENGGE